jgi:hypothetical protein
MGALTVSQILQQGLRKAGNTNLTDNALIWFNAWLKSTYSGWRWPFLRKRASDIALAAGATSLTVGGGVGGVTDSIFYIRDPIYIYNSARTTKSKARIRNVDDNSFEFDESVRDTSNGRGLPESFKVRDTATEGQWQLIPFAVPDAAYSLAFDYYFTPAALVAANTPRYPNDRTMIQSVVCDALQDMKRYDEYTVELEILSSMVADDRAKFGIVPGTMDVLTLDPNTYR